MANSTVSPTTNNLQWGHKQLPCRQICTTRC